MLVLSSNSGIITRGSLQLAELEREGGISPHISPFTEIRDIGALLTQANFTMITIDTDEMVIGYPSMFELMWDLKGTYIYSLNNTILKMLMVLLKMFTLRYSLVICYVVSGMAENNAARNRRLHLKRDTLMAAAAIYKELYGKTREDGTPYIPSTFQIIYLLGWKPHPSQPKPLQRGTGQVSLKDLHKLDEIIKDNKQVKVDEDK